MVVDAAELGKTIVIIPGPAFVVRASVFWVRFAYPATDIVARGDVIRFSWYAANVECIPGFASKSQLLLPPAVVLASTWSIFGRAAWACSIILRTQETFGWLAE